MPSLLNEFLKGSVAEWVSFGIGLLVALWMAWFAFRWRARFREDSDHAATVGEMSQTIAELRRRGDISEEEYRSIKGRLASPSLERSSPREESPTSPTISTDAPTDR